MADTKTANSPNRLALIMAPITSAAATKKTIKLFLGPRSLPVRNRQLVRIEIQYL